MAANNNSYRIIVGVLFALDFIVTLLVLFTDNNLQTDFGATNRYFLHWYGLLITAVIDIIGAAMVFVRPSKGVYTAGLVGSSLLALFLVLDLLTYSMVGFSSMGRFATYLFGVARYPGSLSYIPGLYDGLFILYIITAILSASAVRSYSKSSR